MCRLQGIDRSSVVIYFCFILLANFLACGKSSKGSESHEQNDLPQILKKNELRAIILENSWSYFTSGDKEVGYEYPLCNDYAESLGINLHFVVAHDLDEMRKMLIDGEGDLIAYRMPMSKENSEYMVFTSNIHDSYPVLIQPLNGTISDATELIGKQIHVSKYSHYYHLLHNINEELGGGIEIIEVDSCNVDQLIRKVADGEIPLTIADYEFAVHNRTFGLNFNCNLALGLEQRYGWAVRKKSPILLQSINKWQDKRFQKDLITCLAFSQQIQKKIHISDFDTLFQKYAVQINWDWRLLASLAYHESRFNSQIVSYAGAVGLMQLMPRTAERFGVDSVSMFESEYNILASVQYIKYLENFFLNIKDNQERIKFVLASYNSGPAHVFDARALAQKYGQNPDVWFNSVETYLSLKSQPEYYNDEVCKNGYFRAEYTIRYVRDVLQTYQKYCEF